MASFTIHVDDFTLARLRVAAADLNRPIDDLMECAVSEAALGYVNGKGITFCDPTHPKDCECGDCWLVKECRTA